MSYLPTTTGSQKTQLKKKRLQDQGKRLHYWLPWFPLFFVRTSRGSKHWGKSLAFLISLRFLLKSLYLQASQEGLTFARGPIAGALSNTRAAARSSSLIAILRRTGFPKLLVITNQPDFFGLFLVTLLKNL